MNKEELWFCERLARSGVDFDEIPSTAGIKRRVWRKYFRENPSEKRRFLMLKDATDFAVEDALLKRALGYTAEEVRESDKNGGEIVTTKKDVAPDVRAALEWLKIRRSAWASGGGEDRLKAVRGVISRLDEEVYSDDDEC